jgi:branched-chain amino acid transport system ATP-binding protein
MISVRAGSARARSEPGKVLLEARAITMAFGGFRAVSNADLSIERGEIVGLIGPNGAGKSTFFNCLAGDLRPTAGAVLFDGSDLTRASPEEHARRGIGRTFQVPVTFEDMTVLENVMVGAFLRHPHRRAARAEAGRVLEITGLLAQAGQPAHTLGTPGRKRLEIARVLATGPRLLLLDEALAGLTPVEIQHAIELVREIHRTGITLIIVEHIMEVIVSLTDRVIVFNQGHVIAEGAPRDVMTHPEVVEAYLGRSMTRERRGGRPT